MTMTKFDPKARANEIAAQLKAAEEAQAQYDATIAEAMKNAGRNRVEFVEMLYTHFGIDEETSSRTDGNGDPVKGKNGKPVVVKTDKDETKRISKLAEAFSALVEPSTARPGSNSEAAKPSSAGSVPAKPAATTADQFGKRSQ